MTIYSGWSKVAHSDDDRDWDHQVFGYANEAMVPTSWRMNCPDGPSWWQGTFENYRLERGDMVSETLTSTIYRVVFHTPPPLPNYDLLVEMVCSDVPFDPPPLPPFTVRIGVSVQFGLLQWVGAFFKNRPDPFEDWVVAMLQTFGPDDPFTDPITFTPEKVDY